MYIGNVPKALRLSRKKKGGAVLLGHIPEVRVACFGHDNGLSGVCLQVLGKAKDTDTALADHRARVYHATIRKILESAVTAAGEGGFTFDNGLGRQLAQLIIAILSGDYEE